MKSLLPFLAVLAAPSYLWASPQNEIYSESVAIVISIGEYENSSTWYGLDETKASADAIEQSLTSLGFKVYPLRDKDATKSKIISLLNKVRRQAQPNKWSRLMFFFSGHGETRRIDGDWGYLVPYEATTDVGTMISMKSLQLYLKELGSYEQQLIVLDACFGGLLFTKEQLPTPGRGDPYGIWDLGTAQSLHGLVAGGKSQRVPDGVFTRAFLTGFEGAADVNHDGFVTTAELVVYVQSYASSDGATPRFGVLPGSGEGGMVFAIDDRRGKIASSPVALNPNLKGRYTTTSRTQFPGRQDKIKPGEEVIVRGKLLGGDSYVAQAGGHEFVLSESEFQTLERIGPPPRATSIVNVEDALFESLCRQAERISLEVRIDRTSFGVLSAKQQLYLAAQRLRPSNQYVAERLVDLRDEALKERSKTEGPFVYQQVYHETAIRAWAAFYDRDIEGALLLAGRANKYPIKDKSLTIQLREQISASERSRRSFATREGQVVALVRSGDRHFTSQDFDAAHDLYLQAFINEAIGGYRNYIVRQLHAIALRR